MCLLLLTWKVGFVLNQNTISFIHFLAGFVKFAQRTTSPRNILTSDDLQDGLDICTGDRMVDLSFLHLFYKLIAFTRTTFKCWSKNVGTLTVTNHESTAKDCFDIRDYFANITSDRPKCTCIAGNFRCRDVKNGLLSSNEVAGDDRAYKDVVVLDDGRRMSMEEHHEECFGEKGGNILFLFFVK